jgi:ABC-2 type transport system ATP-binding protein
LERKEIKKRSDELIDELVCKRKLIKWWASFPWWKQKLAFSVAIFHGPESYSMNPRRGPGDQAAILGDDLQCSGIRDYHFYDAIHG